MGKAVTSVLMMLFLAGCGMKHCSLATTGCKPEKPRTECGGFPGPDFRCDDRWWPGGD